MSQCPAFHFRSSFMGESDYDVTDGFEQYRVHWRHHAPDYSPHGLTISREQYEIDVVRMVGTLHRGGGAPIEQRVVDAFNAMLAERHQAFVREMPDAPAPQTMMDAPALVVGARWDSSLHRMVRYDENPAARQAA
ncbi:hypothetical protein E4T66_17580 [Sinimarinibacterium sp. CAU 1509]|uniref:hypothetical protein n=1 Tax=Sinimarinibacterium sp. CAU 1509 TaxID=2562283 RepID=UPI0010AC2C82|nr:hypothetical protein [Sinimarinibacterium sp. CAU 1509]TJY57219.1 hypothetical protein E4T66_17580 [Sinimarinibacterium sp. CAU 1509]